jgi:hypothetical protein
VIPACLGMMIFAGLTIMNLPCPRDMS